MLLIHPLDEQAGGDFFHSGGKHWDSQSDPEWQTLKAFVLGRGDDAMTNSNVPRRSLAVLTAVLLCAVSLKTAEHKVRIIQTNSAGDNVHVIDPATNKVVGVITGIEVNHGAAVAPDGSRIYISDEAESTLDVVDAKTLKVTNRIPLSGHPNNIAIARDGRRVYVGIIQEPGGVDVIDTASAEERQDDSNERHDPQSVRHA